MPTDIFSQLTPFLNRTTAIMTLVIILIVVAAFLVSTERKINRQTVEKLLKLIKSVVAWLIALEFFLGLIEVVKIYFKFEER